MLNWCNKQADIGGLKQKHLLRA